MKVKDAERWLADQGYREVSSVSRKYRKFVAAGRSTAWLGKSGAVRMGETVSASVSMSDAVDRMAKALEEPRFRCQLSGCFKEMARPGYCSEHRADPLERAAAAYYGKQER